MRGRRLLLALLAILALLVSVGIAEAASVRLLADASRSSGVSAVRFAELGPRAGTNSPITRVMVLSRSSTVRIATPRAGRALGRLRFSVRISRRWYRRTVALRRSSSLGEGAYALGKGHGASVILSPRDRTAFIIVSLPKNSRNPQVTLVGAGARMIRFRSCRTTTFGARFFVGDRQLRDADNIPGGRVRRARLC